MNKLLADFRLLAVREYGMADCFVCPPRQPLWMHELTPLDIMPVDEWPAYGWDEDAEEYDASPDDDPDNYMDDAE